MLQLSSFEDGVAAACDAREDDEGDEAGNDDECADDDRDMFGSHDGVSAAETNAGATKSGKSSSELLNTAA